MATVTSLTRCKKRVAAGPLLVGIGWMFALAPIAGLAQTNGVGGGNGSQAPAAKSAAFEIASIRQNKSERHGPPQFGPTADGYRAVNFPLIGLFQTAYLPSSGSESAFFPGNRILGAPEWLKGGERYDVEAKVSEGDLSEWKKPAAQPAMLRAMLQTLLAERCKAVVHREMKEVPVYELVVAKSGSKLKPAETTDAAELKEKHPNGRVIPGGTMVVPGSNPGQLNFFAATIVSLTQALTNVSGRPVVDKTGLTGRYDISLQIEAPAPPRPSGAGEQTQEATSEPGLSIFTLVQEQLGLRLESAKGQVETLVIDHIERPSEN